MGEACSCAFRFPSFLLEFYQNCDGVKVVEKAVGKLFVIYLVTILVILFQL